MKRITSLFLLVFVLLIVVQPVVAFHYCSGKLASSEWYPVADADGCCCHKPGFPASSEKDDIIETECCRTIHYEAHADDYLTVKLDTPLSLNPIGFAALWVRNTFLFVPTETVSFYCQVPPDPLSVTGRELLSRICVFII